MYSIIICVLLLFLDQYVWIAGFNNIKDSVSLRKIKIQKIFYCTYKGQTAIDIVFLFFQAPVRKKITISHFKINSQANAYSQACLMGEDGGGRWCAVKLFVDIGCHFSHDFFGNGFSAAIDSFIYDH